MTWTPTYKDSTKWHSWFAWFPVPLEDGSRAWLQTVQRRVEYGYADWYWYYKL